MSNWIDIPDSSIDAESEVRDFPLGTAPHNILHQMRENNLALFRDGHADAPRIKRGAFANGTIDGAKLTDATVTSASIKPNSVPTAALANDCVTANKMSIATSELSFSNNDTGGRCMINPASFYQLGYTSRFSATVVSGQQYYRLAFPGYDSASFLNGNGAVMDVSPYSPEAFALLNTYTAFVWLVVNYTTTNVPNVEVLIYSPSASPPYSLGHGDIPAFVFADVGPNGELLRIYSSSEPPWAYNGPTNIIPHRAERDGRRFRSELVLPVTLAEAERSPAKMAALIDALRNPVYTEVELTREYKNRDMALIPHPFIEKQGREIVLLDPLSPVVAEVANVLAAGGYASGDILPHVRIGNEPLAGHNAPPGVMVVSAHWS